MKAKRKGKLIAIACKRNKERQQYLLRYCKIHNYKKRTRIIDKKNNKGEKFTRSDRKKFNIDITILEKGKLTAIRLLRIL